jgi:hypothetical protein
LPKNHGDSGTVPPNFYKNILPPGHLDVLEALPDSISSTFYLAGGTGLALHLGTRLRGGWQLNNRCCEIITVSKILDRHDECLWHNLNYPTIQT